MKMEDYWKKVDDNRARVKAESDYKHNPTDFLNPDVETNPYLEMARIYEEERSLIIVEINRSVKE